MGFHPRGCLLCFVMFCYFWADLRLWSRLKIDTQTGKNKWTEQQKIDDQDTSLLILLPCVHRNGRKGRLLLMGGGAQAAAQNR